MNCVLVVFYMNDCPACHEYLPRFRAIAARHPNVQTYLLETEKYAAEADKYGIQGVPVTLALRKPAGMIKVEGGIPDDQIEWFFRVAETNA